MKKQLLLLYIVILSVSSSVYGQTFEEDVFFRTIRDIPIPGVLVNNSLVSDDAGRIPKPDTITSIDYDKTYPGAVDVLDIIMIQRHILGLDRFEYPYQKIAADLDANGIINGVDVFIARKTLYFEQAMNWSFIESDSLGIQSSPSKSYVGICHGDVSGNVLDATPIEKKYKVLLEDQILNKGETYKIPFTLSEEIDCYGLEFHVEIDTHKVEYILTTPDQQLIDFQWIQRKKGYLVGLGYNLIPIAADTMSPVTTLSIRALENTTLNEALKGNASRTSLIVDEELTKQRVIFSNQNILYPNQVESSTLDHIVLGPNPTMGRMSIVGLDSDEFTLDIYNSMGVKVKRHVNDPDIDMTDYPSGMYYYTLTVDGVVDKGKIMLVR